MGPHGWKMYAITLLRGTLDESIVWMAYTIHYRSLLCPFADVKGRYGEGEWEGQEDKDRRERKGKKWRRWRQQWMWQKIKLGLRSFFCSCFWQILYVKELKKQNHSGSICLPSVWEIRRLRHCNVWLLIYHPTVSPAQSVPRTQK